jgi:hypothetical protein
MKRRTLLASGAAALTGCVGGGSAVEDDAPPRERLRQHVGAVVNSRSIGQSPAAEIEQTGDGFEIIASYEVNSSLGADGTKDLTDEVAYDVAERVYQDAADVSSFGIAGLTPVVDEYGNESEEELTLVEIEDSTAERIVWDNTNYTDVEDFADRYYFRDRYF